MRLLKTICLPLVAILVLVAPAWAKFDEGLLNISWGNKDVVPEGKAVLGVADSDKWNAMDGNTGEKIALNDSKGDKADVLVTYNAAGTYDADKDGGFVGTKWENLLRHYLHTVNASSITLTGLTPNAQYELVVYSASDADGRKTKFTVGKDTATVKYDKDKKDFAEGYNYARFVVSADDAGNVEFTFEGLDGGEGNLNGLQIAPMRK
jgi:hypothetical protein